MSCSAEDTIETMPSATLRPIHLLFIVFLAGILWGGQYIRRNLWEPDEARYAHVAWEMRETGHWFTPQRNGQAYSHKPPLMFWLINLASGVTGGEIGSVAARLPSFLGAVLSLWVVGSLAARWGSAKTVWPAIALCATSFRFWHQGGWGQIDMLLCGLELAAVYLLIRNDEQPAFWRTALAFSAMGWAILAKGPVGFIVPVGIYLVGSLLSGHSRQLRRAYWLWGIPLTLAWPAIWLLLAWWEGAPPEYFREVLFSQNISRAAGQFGGHAKPIFYYLIYLPMDFLPWTLLFPLAVAAHRREAFPAKQAARFLVGWMLFVFLFFTLITTKRGLYILSLYPAAALYVALSWERVSSLPRSLRRPCAALFWFGYAAAVFSCVVVAFIPGLPVAGTSLLPVAVLLLAGSLWIKRQATFSLRWLAAVLTIVFAVEAYAGAVVLPALNALKTPRGLLPIVHRALPEGKTLTLYRIHGEALSLYARRQGCRVDHFNELVLEMVKQHHGLMVCRRHEWDDLDYRLAHFGEWGEFSMGDKDFVWFIYDMSTWTPGP